MRSMFSTSVVAAGREESQLVTVASSALAGVAAPGPSLAGGAKAG